MAIYLGPNELATGGGGAGGGAIPETISFISDGVWNVPQSVQDEIALEGSAEVGLLMVGGGDSNRSGEVINQLYRLTAEDYDDPNAAIKQISVFVGATLGADSGITTSPPSPLTTNLSLNNAGVFAGGYPNNTFNFPVTKAPEFDGNGWPIVNSISLFTTSNGVNITYSEVTWSGSIAPSSLTLPVMTWSGGAPFDGTLSFKWAYEGGRISYYYLLTYDQANLRFQLKGWNDSSNHMFSSSPVTGGSGINYNNGPQPKKFAKGASNPAASNTFFSNPTSTEGYFGGYGRFNGGAYGSGGSNPTKGYVQIFYS